MEARICAAVSPGKVLFEGIPATTMSAPCQWAAHPAPRSSPRLHSTSDSLGTARSRTGPRQRSAAARSGSTLFFAAGIAAVPFSGRPPITQIRPLCCVISAAPIPQKIPHNMQKQGRMSRFEFVNVFVSLSRRATRQQPCPLRQRCRAATSPRGRGSGVTGRPTLDEQSLRWPETVVPCYRDSQQLNKVRLFRSLCPL